MKGYRDLQIGSAKWAEVIINEASAFNVDIDDDAMIKFGIHAENMVVFNRKINLTTITDPFEIAIKHIVDSLVAVPFLKKTKCLLDIGTGAGFPGIPIKIVKPQIAVTLIDSVARKVSFLKHVISQLSIDNLQAIHMRAETNSHLLPGPFDAVVTRAIGSLTTCWQLSRQLINRQTGTFIAFRGRVTDKELMAFQEIIQNQTRQSKNGSRWALSFHPYRLPNIKDSRSLIVLRFFQC